MAAIWLKGGLSSLRRLKNFLPQRKLDQFCKALFESHLRYGNIFWSTLAKTKLSQLQRLQTRAKKLIANAKYKDGWTCKWLSVESLISFDQGVMTYKILHDLCPENLRHKFTERSMISEYRTRNRGDLQTPKVRLEYAKRSFYCLVSKTGMISLITFEKEIQSLFLEQVLEIIF